MKTSLTALAAAIVLSFAAPALAQPEQAAPTEQASPSEAATPTESAAPAASPAPVSAALPEGISPPPEGKGQVIFFRPSRFVGAALSFTVRENDVPLGRLPNGRYFVHVAEPGIHAYEIGNNDTMRMEIEPGETYYAIQSTQMGIVAGRAVLSPSDQAAFETALPRMRVSEPVEAGH